MVNRGAATNPKLILETKSHTIPVKMENYIDINKNLTLEEIEQFLSALAKFGVDEQDYDEEDPSYTCSNNVSDKDSVISPKKDSQ